MASDLIGKTGQVTGTVRPDCIGEVTLNMQPGTQAFHARPADNETEYPIGHVVEVVAFSPPQTVYVRGFNATR